MALLPALLYRGCCGNSVWMQNTGQGWQTSTESQFFGINP